MTTIKWRWLALAALLAGLATPAGSAPPVQAEVGIDLATATEATAGQYRVAFVSAARHTEFAVTEAGKPPRRVTSLRVVYLVEALGGAERVTRFDRVKVYAAGGNEPVAATRDLPDAFERGAVLSATNASRLYSAYKADPQRRWNDWLAGPDVLPPSTDPNADMITVTLHDVKLTAATVDIVVRVGADDVPVRFKNVQLD